MEFHINPKHCNIWHSTISPDGSSTTQGVTTWIFSHTEVLSIWFPHILIIRIVLRCNNNSVSNCKNNEKKARSWIMSANLGSNLQIHYSNTTSAYIMYIGKQKWINGFSTWLVLVFARVIQKVTKLLYITFKVLHDRKWIKICGNIWLVVKT